MSKPINQRPKRPAAGAHPLPKRSKIVLVANMRSTPLPGATLCIRPYAGIQKDNYQIPFHGITFNQVQEAFNSVQGKDDNVSYVFEFPGSENEWEKLSTNPFYHYETWIRKSDHHKHGRPDREIPDENNEEIKDYIEYIGSRLWIKENDGVNKPSRTRRGGGNGEQYEFDKVYEIMQGSAGACFTWENKYGIVPLSADRMRDATGKNREGGQQSIMSNTSPVEVACGLGWNKDDKQLSGGSIAEWLHISAFAYGGLMDMPKSTQTSQMKMNFVLGTAETNSVMLRYETAWKTFFLKEQELRDLMQLPGNGRKVNGQLTFVNNIEQTIQNRQLSNGEHVVRPIDFDRNEWLNECFEKCPWMCFALHYTLSMDGLSRVLDWYKPTFSTIFYPFSRPFYTKGESTVDMILLKVAFDAQTVMLQGIPPMPCERSLMTYPLKKSNIDACLVARRSLRQAGLVDIPEPACQKKQLAANLLQVHSLPVRSSVETAAKHFVTADAAHRDKSTIFVGGIPVHNTSIVVSPKRDKFADLPVAVCSVSVPPTEGTIFLPSGTNMTDINTSSEKATLVVSSAPRSGVHVANPSGAETLQDVIKEPLSELCTIDVHKYILKGDIHNLLGISGLSGHLYLFHSRDNAMPTTEKVKIKLEHFGGDPFAGLFPQVRKALAHSIPISNVEFVYSEGHTELRHTPGLRLEADIEFRGALEPVADLLGVLFSVSGNTPPVALHVSAHLSHTRDWTTPPSFSSLILQGSFENMSFMVGDLLKIQTVGVEIAFINVADLTGTGSTWSRGYGIFGELEIYQIPGTAAPLRVAYKMTKFTHSYQMVMQFTSTEWEDVFGIQGLNITDVNFYTFFSSISIKDSLVLAISASMKFGDAHLVLTGHFSKAETYLEARVGNLSWSTILAFYSQLTGTSIDNQLESHDISFEDMHIILSTKGVVIEGKVRFNGHTSLEGYLELGKDGISIGGGVADFLIDDARIEIKQARIDVFVASTKSTCVSRFSIHGKVSFSGITVTAAFMIEGKETKSELNLTSERQWFLFGRYEGNLRLRDMCPGPIEGEIGDLELRNITLIAASGEMADIKKLNTLKYPVKKGISLCATISPVEELNGFAQRNIDGLILIATIEDTLVVQIRLPTAFDVEITKTAKLTDISVGIEISENPSLMVTSVLNILMEPGKDPLRLEGRIKAGLRDASALVVTKSPWVNPFNISKEVTVVDFKVLLGVTYATLEAFGPSQMALAGTLRVGELTASAGMSISQYPDQQLLKADISKVDLIQIIRVAGHVANIEVLKNISGGEDTFVFTKAYVYVSTGASIGGKEYRRGISAGGGLTAFGKTARFDLRIGAGGLDFQGYIENFSVGPLAVSSASGEPQASMVMRMTRDEQVIKVDGMITCFGIGLAVLVDIQMGTDTPSFTAYLAVQFTDAFKIGITATVADFRDVKDLALKDLYFEGRIEGDLFEVVCQSIKGMLQSIEELGTQGLTSLQHFIGEKIAERQREMDQLAQKVTETREKVASERQRRQAAMQCEKGKREEAKEKIKRLQDNLADKIAGRDRVEKELKKNVEKAKLERAALIQRKRREYDEKLKQAKQREADNRRRLEELKYRQRTKYGTDFLKKVDLAKGALYEKQAAERASWNAVVWVYWQKEYASVMTVAYWATRLEVAKAAHEAVKAATAVYHEAASGLEATANSDAFQTLVAGIEEAEKGVERAVNGIDKLTSGNGFDGFVKAFIDTEESKIDAAIRELDAMQNENSELQKAVQEAQEILGRDRPELEREIVEADEAIERLQEDAELAKLQRDYDNQLKIHDEVHNVIQGMQAGLETLKENWQDGMHELENVVDSIQKAVASIIHIERIEVAAHTHALANNEPLKFVFIGDLGGERFNIHAEWSPGNSLQALYKEVTEGILEFAGDRDIFEI
ncbi:hypothetical protein MferCBS49748_006796 [Microsporum ferrugineum]